MHGSDMRRRRSRSQYNLPSVFQNDIKGMAMTFNSLQDLSAFSRLLHTGTGGANSLKHP